MTEKRGIDQAPVTMPPERSAAPPPSPSPSPPPPSGGGMLIPEALRTELEGYGEQLLVRSLPLDVERAILRAALHDELFGAPAGRRPLAVITNRAPARDRLRAFAPPAERGATGTSWYRIENKAATNQASVYIYDEIGFWGVTAQDFAAELNGVNASTMDVHINSPGGEVYDGLAIYNAIKQHKATVTIYIDGLAASAASFIAQAGDSVVIARNAEIIIHDAMGAVFGNASEMAEMVKSLDRVSENIADIYAQRAGGTVSSWREAMKAETWYTAKEAVAAGLADKMTDADSGEDAQNAWGGLFRYRNRLAAPPPIATHPTLPDPPITQGGDRVDVNRPPNPLPVTPEALADAFAIDPELFRAAMTMGLDDLAAPDLASTEPAAPAPLPAFPADILRRAVREARDGA
jgi:ATP-dependent Clp endopeptidase proteolytic subunit ClpP